MLNSKSVDPYVYPETLDLTSQDFAPFSSISFYSTMTPIAFNFTVIHPLSSSLTVKKINWKTENEFIKRCLVVDHEHSNQNVPYYSLIRMKISVKHTTECKFASAEGENIKTTISFQETNQTANYSLILNLIQTPAREERILIDAFHNLKFPEDGYILRDSIFIDKQPYEWKGDHVFTNYMQLYTFLNSQGYYIEILNEPLTCFDSNNYGTLMLADPEKGLSRNEIIKLRRDIETRGLSLVIIAEWSDSTMMDKHTFTSEFTRKVWKPLIAGSNLQSINTLLRPYGIMFKESSYSGTIAVGEEKFKVESGAILQKFPNKGYLFSGKLVEDAVAIQKIDEFDEIGDEIHPMVGIYDLSDENNSIKSGSILAIGDSYCIESAAPVNCFNMISEFISSQKQKYKQSLLYSEEHRLKYDFNSDLNEAPFQEKYRQEVDKCSGTNYFSLKDEMHSSFQLANTVEFITKWEVTDDAKYVYIGDNWLTDLSFKYEIIFLSVIALLIMCSLAFYIWYQRKRNIQYMKIVPDVDI